MSLYDWAWDALRFFDPLCVSFSLDPGLDAGRDISAVLSGDPGVQLTYPEGIQWSSPVPPQVLPQERSPLATAEGPTLFSEASL